jgi:hypothetical protein
MNEDLKTIEVSEEFVDIFQNLNITDKVTQMRSLSRKELLLLIILALDKHDEEDKTVVHNLLPFYDEAMIIESLQETGETTDIDLLDLIKETGYEKVETDNITHNGKLPKIITSKSEIRDKKIDLLNND